MACNVGRHLGTCWAAPATRVCRPSAGVCDVADKCNGTDLDCPADSFKPTGFLCKAVAGPCDLPDMCTGSSASCPASYEPAGIPCRAAAGICDAPDFCTGSTATCTDTKKTSATVCRPSAGVCDVADKCDGKTNDCPANKFAAATVRCRNAAGTCDAAEYCTGLEPSCPEDVYKPSSTVCRAAADPQCDIAETCTGSTITCPANSVKPNGTVCDDGLFCDGVDICKSGKCQIHSGDPCIAPLVCDDKTDTCRSSETAWTDPGSGLTWQNGSSVGGEYSWQDAQDYCDNLAWAGYSDWWLPNIDQLRSLIDGCADTEQGGACNVSTDCWSNSVCRNAACNGCGLLSGPGSSGAYWPSEISGDVTSPIYLFYWSSTKEEDSPTAAWGVRYEYGSLDPGNINYPNWGRARCVRF